MIDLDHNAGTNLRPEARAALLRGLDLGGNPSSIHGLGRRARRHLEDAREQIAMLADTTADRVVFTSGGTEANALALHGRRVLASAVEHPAVLAQPGVVETRLPVDARGLARVDAVASGIACSSADTLALMAANNETGVVQPLAAVRAALPENVRLHVDAVQAPSRLELAPIVRGADTVALSAHKVGGPQGAGALILGADVEPAPLVAGGGQERGRRGGTENVAAAMAFAAALQAAARPEERRRMAALRDRLETRLQDAIAEVVVLGAGAERLVNTLAVTAPGWAAERLIVALDLAGVAVSSGAACSSGKVGGSHVLDAMGLRDDLKRGALRLSVGWCTTDEEIDRALVLMTPILAEAWRATGRAA